MGNWITRHNSFDLRVFSHPMTNKHSRARVSATFILRIFERNPIWPSWDARTHENIITSLSCPCGNHHRKSESMNLPEIYNTICYRWEVELSQSFLVRCVSRLLFDTSNSILEEVFLPFANLESINGGDIHWTSCVSGTPTTSSSHPIGSRHQFGPIPTPEYGFEF